MRQGTNEVKIIAQAKTMGMSLPAAIKNKPQLRIGLDFYRRAFWDCSTDRDLGMAEGPIPWTSIDKWAQRYDVVGDDFDRLVQMLRAMDNIYIEERAKQSKKKLGKKSGGSFKPKAGLHTKG